MRLAWVWAAAGVIGLHGTLFIAVRPAEGLGAGRVRPVIGNTEVEGVVHARVVQSHVPLPILKGVAPKEVPQGPRSRLARPEASVPAGSAHDSTATATANAGIYFFERGSLDRIAEPVGEWTIDTSLLPPTGESSFQVSIWVSMRGEIEKWDVKSSTLDEDITAAVFARLNETVMNPALIGTRPVASVLHFELSAERQ